MVVKIGQGVKAHASIVGEDSFDDMLIADCGGSKVTAASLETIGTAGRH